MPGSTSTLSSLACPPRFGTERNPDRPTYGPEVEAWHRVLTNGKPFHPWQRYVADVAGEYDPDTGLRHYETVVLIVPRQAGKSTLFEAGATWSSHRAPDQEGLLLAQDRQMARKRLIEEYWKKRLMRCAVLEGRYEVRQSQGSEQITWDNGSKWVIGSNDADASHGLTLTDVFIDEAFAHNDFTVIDGTDATTITIPDPQTWIVSTVGDGSDVLLQHYQGLGRASLDDPDTQIAIFEWSAEDDDDRADPEVWRRVHPALGFTITEQRLANRLKSLKPPQFDRMYLNRRPRQSAELIVDAAKWAQCGIDGGGPRQDEQVALFVDVSPERTQASIAAACVRDGAAHVVVDTRPGVDWIPQTVLDLVRTRKVVIGAVDGRSPAANLRPNLDASSFDWEEFSTAEMVQACSDFYDGVVAEVPTIWHANQQVLDKAMQVAKKRPVGEAWAWGRKISDGDITPLVAATGAVALIRRWEREYGGDLRIY